jgi:hypothetical protein
MVIKIDQRFEGLDYVARSGLHGAAALMGIIVGYVIGIP